MSKYSIFFTIIFLVIISIISFWLNNEVKKELNIEEKKLTNNPDYFLKNFISKQTDDLGNLNFSLEAIQMNYFSYSDESILKEASISDEISKWMSTNPFFIYEHNLATSAAELMEKNKISSLVVVDNRNDLVGVINFQDLLINKVI